MSTCPGKEEQDGMLFITSELAKCVEPSQFETASIQTEKKLIFLAG